MRKRIVLMVMVVMLAGAYFATDSNAAAQWYYCKVEMAGPAWGATYIQLTDTSSAFSKKWFAVPTDSAKQILATALTAMSGGMQVLVYSDLATSGYPTINAFYMLNS